MKLYQRLSRVMTRGRDFIPQIDGLRFVAIISVLAYHVRAITAWHWHYGVALDGAAAPDGVIGRVFGAGCKGVELFFAISGFILALPFARQHLGQGEPFPLKAYYLRRLTRLEPPYLIQLVFVFLITWLFLRHQPAHVELYHQPDWLAHTLRHLGVSLFYGSGLVYHAYPQPNIVLWSLEYEVQFYLLAPLLAWVFLLRTPLARQLTIFGLMLLPMAMGHAMAVIPWLGWTVLGKLQFFMAGFLLCELYLEGRVDTDQPRHLWDCVFFAAFAIVVFTNGFWIGQVLLPWAQLLACVAAFKGKWMSRILSHPLLTTIGGMCYTIYMYHWLMISGLIRITRKLFIHIFWADELIQFVILSAIIIAICAGLFALFERPFMKRDWPKTFWAWVTHKPTPTD
jgi:peptidoglycan/LPS O-acetylase OafA/YrhL